MAALIQANLKPDHRAFSRYKVSQTLEVREKITRVEITPGESERGKREREEQEARQALERKAQTPKDSSYTGNGAAKVIGDSSEQCVIYARRITGNGKIRGYAGSISPETQKPRIGAVALEKGHVSVVVALLDDAVLVHEANYLKGHITERRVPYGKIRGYVL